MSTFGKRFIEAREESGLNQTKAANAVGLKAQAVQHIENPEKNALGSSHTASFAALFGVNALWLESGIGPKKSATMTAEQNRSPYGTEEFANTIPGPEVRTKIPLISWVQAGLWQSAVDNYHPGQAGEWVIPSCPVHQHTYALRVVGESMTNPAGEPTFPHGQVIVVEPDLIDSLDRLVNFFVIVRRNGNDEATFKKLVKDAGVFYLMPLNPAYPRLELRQDDQLCGVVREKTVRYA